MDTRPSLDLIQTDDPSNAFAIGIVNNYLTIKILKVKIIFMSS
jgi:hypothetical protein